MAASSEHKGNSSQGGLSADVWMIRPCEFYRQEYEDCKSIRGRFHHYYIYGTFDDCKKWKYDFNNCLKFVDTNSPEAAEEILVHERLRMKERLAGAKGNDVWEYRTSPPPEWNEPLDKWTKQRENTILGRVSQSGTATPEKLSDGSFCVIL